MAGSPAQHGHPAIYEFCARVGGLANNVRIVRSPQEFVREMKEYEREQLANAFKTKYTSLFIWSFTAKLSHNILEMK